MSTTTEAATWPRVEATLHEDGTAEVSIGGSVQTINAQNVDEARPQVVALIAQRAAQLGRPLRALTRDPEGEWPIIIHGDGTVAEDVGAAAHRRDELRGQRIEVMGVVHGHEAPGADDLAQRVKEAGLIIAGRVQPRPRRQPPLAGGHDTARLSRCRRDRGHP